MFEEAEYARRRIEDLKKLLSSKQIKKIESDHNEEINFLKQNYEKEIQSFEEFWKQKFENFEEISKKEENALTAEHEKTIIITQKNLEENNCKKIIKHSVEYLNLKKTEAYLKKQDKYITYIIYIYRSFKS